VVWPFGFVPNEIHDQLCSYLTGGAVNGSTQSLGQDVDLEERWQRQTEEPGRRAGHGRDVQARHVEVDEHRSAVLPALRATPGAHAAAALRVVREVRVPADSEPASVLRPELNAERVDAGPRLRRDGRGGWLLASTGARYHHGSALVPQGLRDGKGSGGAWSPRIVCEFLQGLDAQRGGSDTTCCGSHWKWAGPYCVERWRDKQAILPLTLEVAMASVGHRLIAFRFVATCFFLPFFSEARNLA
jgi:hypothetical protein